MGPDLGDPPPMELATVDELPVIDEQDEQSVSERYDTDGEHSNNADQCQVKGIAGPMALEVDLKRRLSPTLHVDSATVALPPVFQPLPSHFLPDFFATRSHPWNRSGFRYLACGPLVDQQSRDPEHPIYYTIETVPPGLVKWSWEDRSSYAYITKDALSVTTDRGFRSARANCPIREGKWYFEVTMVRAGGEINQGPRSDPEEAHVRVGIARRETGLNAPLGIDGYSYAIRDKTGQKVHLSRPQKYGEPFRSGDVIGILVYLPKIRKPQEDDWADPARIERKRIPIRYRRQLYFESAEYPVSKEMEELAESALPSKLKPKQEPHKLTTTPSTPRKKSLPGQKMIDKEPSPLKGVPKGAPLRELPVLKGSKLIFFKNGVCQGVAFEDLLDFLPLRADTLQQSNEADNQSNHDLNLDLNSNSKGAETLHDDGTLGYYPCVSVYGGGIARLNAGPEFKFPPPESIDSLLNKNTDTLRCNSPGDVLVKEDPAWRPLSELYPIYLAEQRRLDELDAIENQKQSTETNHPVDLSNKTKSSSKRKCVSSASLTAGGATASKGKKKGKLAVNSESLHPYPFKPSPLGNVEVFDEDDTKVGIEEQVTTTTSSTGLSILCQVASGAIMVNPPDLTTVSEAVDPSNLSTINPVKSPPPAPSNLVSSSLPGPPLVLEATNLSQDAGEQVKLMPLDGPAPINQSTCSQDDQPSVA